MSIAIPMHQNFIKRADSGRSADTTPCYVCGKPCRNPRYLLHVHGGGLLAVTEEEAATMSENADLGLHPVGSDCLKKHPELKPYAQK